MKEEHVREDYVLQALSALAENDREREAPPEVEARLLGAFHSRHARRVHRIQRGGLGAVWAVSPTLAAGLAIALLLWPNRTPKPAVGAAPAVLPVPESARPFREAEPTPKVARASPKLARKAAAAEPPQPHEVVTDFFPLMNPAPSFGRGQMLRVQLPAAAMQTVGLPVREEHLGDLVQADVLVGEEGMPRAIRFVRFDVK
jgi:hypothetical protein